MQIKHINLVKSLHQALPHAAEGWIIQEGMIGDDTYNALLHLVHFPLGKTDELHIVIVQPLWIFFTQGLTVKSFL